MKSIFQNKTLTFIIIFLLVANLGLLAYYIFFKDRRSHAKRKHIYEFVKNDLKFDETQMKTFEDSRGKNRQRVRQLLEDLANTKDSFYQLVLIENLDDSILFDRGLAIADKQRAVDMEFFRQFKALQAMCTPEQLTRFDSTFMPMVKRMYRQQRRDDGKNKK
jgi:periplasmic protein CpxP/Spy